MISDNIRGTAAVAALASLAMLASVELATEKPDAATDSDRLPDGLAGTWERRTPDGRMEATIADGAIEVVRVSGDSREVCWRGVYEAKGRKWVVREAPKESHTANTAYHDSSRTASYSAPSCRAIPRRDAWPPSRKGDRYVQ